MSKINLYRKIYEYVPRQWGSTLILSFIFCNSGVLWLVEEFLGIEHKIYWYDAIMLMVWILVAFLIMHIEDKILNG